MTAGGCATREEHGKRERQNGKVQVEGTGNIRFTRRDACLQCTRSDFSSIPPRFWTPTSFHAPPAIAQWVFTGFGYAELDLPRFKGRCRIGQIENWDNFIQKSAGRKFLFLYDSCVLEGCDLIVSIFRNVENLNRHLTKLGIEIFSFEY